MNYTPEQKAAWDRVMQILKDNLDGPAYNTWFKPLEMHSISGDKLVIVGQSTFSLQHMQNRYGTMLLSTIDMVFDRKYQLEFYTQDEIRNITRERFCFVCMGKPPWKNAMGRLFLSLYTISGRMREQTS